MSDLSQRLRDAAALLRGGEANPAKDVLLEAAQRLEDHDTTFEHDAKELARLALEAGKVPALEATVAQFRQAGTNDAKPESGPDGSEQPRGETQRSDT